MNVNRTRHIQGSNLWIRSCICGLLFIGAGTASLSAQSERYELGKRVHRFEQAWQNADAELRKRSVEPMVSAVNSFFSLRLLTAAEWIDRAFLSTYSTENPSDFLRWALAQHVVVNKKAFDREVDQISATVQSFYPVPELDPTECRAEMVLTKIGSENERILPLALEDGRWQWSESSASWDEGDYRLRVRLTCGEQTSEIPSVMISVIDRLQPRLEALEASTKEKTQWKSSTVRSSLRGWMQLLKSLATDASQETDYPAFRLLTLAEGLVIHPDDRSSMEAFAKEESGIWLNLVQNNKTLPIRMRVPHAYHQGDPLPVLVAYHGAGGSENMFFESYGAGRTIELALERGWCIVCPRQGLLGLGLDLEPMLDELQSLFTLDRNKVYVLGHSMGAAQAIQQSVKFPTLPRAVAALGGGRGLSSVPSAMNFPWFVAAGKQDFGRAGAQALASSLEKSGRSVDYREYPDVEHLVIVQAALDDLFSFFDQK